jgi:circadian clock protein KaiC
VKKHRRAIPRRARRKGDRVVAGTGVKGLDDILNGGLTQHRLHLVEGDPGAGKTTLAIQFLLEGRRLGERGLYITLSETEQELREGAQSHGWSLEGIDIFELKAVEQRSLGGDVSLFHPGEVELGEAMKTLLEEVNRVDPARVVFDSLSEIRLLAQQALRYRRQILALKQHFVNKKCTVLLLDDRTAEAHDKQVMSIAHGAIELEQSSPAYGNERRRVRVAKMRGRAYRGGFHDYTITTAGVCVFPRLVAAFTRDLPDKPVQRVSSDNVELDKMLGGGLMRSTSTLIAGPPGSGKSSIVATFAVGAAARGELAIIYLFDENPHTFVTRSLALGLDPRPHILSGKLVLQQIDPAELTPGEFVSAVRDRVDEGARFVAIDSLNGYINAMPEEMFLQVLLHELLTYLAQCETLTFLVTPQHGFVGPLESRIDVSYLADNVIVTRYFEARGAVHNAISVMKQRSSFHEKTIREFTIGAGGLTVGKPLSAFRGVLGGTPEYSGEDGDLFLGAK